MASLRSIAVDSRQRARRWDAIVIGSGVASLMAAARIGMREQRVLVIEEQAAADRPACLQEPPMFAGAGAAGILEPVLRELRLPLIDRRRFVSKPLAYQVVGPDLRLDIGEHGLTASELVAWGLAKPDVAESLVDGLDRAAEIEREHLLAAPLVRTPGLRALTRKVNTPELAHEGARGLPDAVADASPKLGRVLAAQVRALGNHAEGGPSSEACARLLGAPLQGGFELEPGAGGLIPVLRRRVEALYGEFRSVRGGFELVNAKGAPGVALAETGEIWLGKAIVAGSSPLALAQALGQDAIAPQLGARAGRTRRRFAFHWRLPRAVVPEGMASRVILLPDPGTSDPQEGVVTLTVSASRPRSRQVDLVARALPAPGENELDLRRRIETTLLQLMPFSEDALELQTDPRPQWDDDDWLDSEPAGQEWPGDALFRVGSRPPVYRLDRPAIAGLGLEGELLLGWRAGDAIAEELA